MARIFIETYGCTLNRADSDMLKGVLLSAGHEITENESDADVIVLNTCTVKGPTENKTLERLRKLHAAGRRIAVSGCMAAETDRIRTAAPDAPVVWPHATGKITEAIEAALEGRKAEFRAEPGKESLPRLFTAPILRIPVCEGCVGSCNFCQTKLARPKLFSYRPKTIREWIAHGAEKGAKEVQLTAMDMGAYGLDIKTDLVSLMGTINAMDDDFLVRVGMTNPEHALRMVDGMIEEMKNGKFYHFLHIPVQAGSEKVVKEMGRRHTVADFGEVARRFREAMPDITIATDIIAGYPTETDDDFEETKKLLERVRPDVVNLSRFSPRPGTRAKELKQLPSETIKGRSRELTALVHRICRENNRKLVGKEFDVLITEKQKDYTGRTRGYRQVVVKDSGGCSLGEKARVIITDANHGALFGEKRHEER